MEWFDVIRREFVYISYFFSVQFRQIAFYWIFGMLVGSLVSVFAKDAIHNCFEKLKDKKWGVWGGIPASLLGIASSLCMYGTIPIAASFSRHGMRHDWVAAFMMSSVLLNPQLLFYSTALGATALAGILLSALFQRYVPAEGFAELFGKRNEGFGVLMAATIGVPLYACGGGTIPLLQQWLVSGMSMGSAAAFMITGPATKITNLGALKIVLGVKRFALYIAFVMAFSLLTGLVTNLAV